MKQYRVLLGENQSWSPSLNILAFFAPKFLFPALIAAAVFPSLVAYSGPVFSTISLWIVGIILIAGFIVTLAHGPILGSAHQYFSIAALVESQLGKVMAALAASASLFGLMIAVGTLLSTGATFLVEVLDLDSTWRIWLVSLGFVLLAVFLLYPTLIRPAIPWVSGLMILVCALALGYGYLQYFLQGGKPSLFELLSGSTTAFDTLAEDYFPVGWKATAVAALLLVPVSPSVVMFRNENHVALSTAQFRFLGGMGAAAFALTVYLSFVVAGFHWMHLDTVLEGPDNLVLLLEIMLKGQEWVTVPLMVLLSFGFLVAAYIYLSSASVLLAELGKHDLLVHQVSWSWKLRGRSVVVLSFLMCSFVVAVWGHTRMDLVVLYWVFFVLLASFLGQLARVRLWNERYLNGYTSRRRRQAARHRLIAVISLLITLVLLVVVTLALRAFFQVVAVFVWLILAAVFMAFNRYYHRRYRKEESVVHYDSCLTHTRAVVVVSDFSAVCIPAIRYAWAAHHAQLEILVIKDSYMSQSELLEAWKKIEIPSPLTIVSAVGQDYISPVYDFVQALLEQNPNATVSVYLPWRGARTSFFNFFHNVTSRAYYRRLRYLDRVTVTNVYARLG